MAVRQFFSDISENRVKRRRRRRVLPGQYRHLLTYPAPTRRSFAVTDNQRPPESPSFVPLLATLRGEPAPTPDAPSNADLNAALRAGWGIPGSPIEESDHDDGRDSADGPPDFGGGPRGLSPALPSPDGPLHMNDVLRAAAGRTRRDAFTGLGAALHLNEED
jgi:hypothetical protein